MGLLKCMSLLLHIQLGFWMHLSFTVSTGRGGKVVDPHLMTFGQKMISRANEYGRRWHSMQLDSLCHDLASVCKGGLIPKPGSDAPVGRIIPSCLSADDPMVTATPGSGDVPGQLPTTVEISAELKDQLKKEIQQYGKGKHAKNFY